jgi:hypothetical protein
MAALETVADYLAQARSLLQDLVPPYRYVDDDLVNFLNLGMLEMNKMRPDLMLATPTSVPSYSTSSPTTSVAIDQQYRVAILYYMVGQAQLRDAEDVSDSRALALLTNFSNQLLSNGA